MALILLPMGCGTAPPPTFSPAGEIDAAMRENPPLHLSPLKEGTWAYDVIDGDGKGKSVTQVVKFDPSNVTAPWSRLSSANNVISHLRQEPDGAIVMTANEILDHDVTNVFDPPQITLPAPAALGAPVRLTSKVVTSLRSGSRFQIDHGTAELLLTPGGIETIDTPAGHFTCRHIDLKLHLKFGFGEAESWAKHDYADQVGLVAETYYEKSVAFFMTSTRMRKTLLTAYPH